MEQTMKKWFLDILIEDYNLIESSIQLTSDDTKYYLTAIPIPSTDTNIDSWMMFSKTFDKKRLNEYYQRMMKDLTD